MKNKFLSWELIVLIVVLYISLGDKVLPGAAGETSAKVRQSINNFVVGLVPNWQPSVDPYKRTEDAIEQEEKQE
ncbi:MAG: hypothetical protein ACO3NK_02600 [Prochlorotrichaceae cyanobacterium]|jgi:Sec-independent protein translocase protein TatA